MSKPLDAIKDNLKKRYLGKDGVHGISISRPQNAVRVYVHTEFGVDSTSLLQQIIKEASPYQVIVVKEDRPFIS